MTTSLEGAISDLPLLQMELAADEQTTKPSLPGRPSGSVTQLNT